MQSYSPCVFLTFCSFYLVPNVCLNFWVCAWRCTLFLDQLLNHAIHKNGSWTLLVLLQYTMQRKKTDRILRIFTFNDKNLLHLPLILTIQLFWGSKWSKSDLISYNIIWHIPNIKNTEFKLKNARLIFSDNTSDKFWPQLPSASYQCCLQVSEIASWHKLQFATLPTSCNIK